MQTAQPNPTELVHDSSSHSFIRKQRKPNKTRSHARKAQALTPPMNPGRPEPCIMFGHGRDGLGSRPPAMQVCAITTMHHHIHAPSRQHASKHASQWAPPVKQTAVHGAITSTPLTWLAKEANPSPYQSLEKLAEFRLDHAASNYLHG